MLPSKIDLTEKGDFGGNIRLVPIPDVIIPFEVYNENMSYDQYLYLEWFEGIFGKKFHWTEKHQIFDKDIYCNDGYHCNRCGKEFKIPWKRVFNLCPKCDSDISVRIPWKRFINTWVDDKGYNLFNLR